MMNIRQFFNPQKLYPTVCVLLTVGLSANAMADQLRQVKKDGRTVKLAQIQPSQGLSPTERQQLEQQKQQLTQQLNQATGTQRQQLQSQIDTINKKLQGTTGSEQSGLGPYNRQQQFNNNRTNPTPLVLDLNRDGKIKFSDHFVRFDIRGNGHPDLINWVSKNEAFLFLDLNGNGTVDDGRELFGSATLLKDLTLAKDGFMALSQYDDFSDNVIDANDSVFDKLAIWQDLNEDGICTPNEVTYLKDTKITALSLKYGLGNEQLIPGMYFEDGQIDPDTAKLMADVFFTIQN